MQIALDYTPFPITYFLLLSTHIHKYTYSYVSTLALKYSANCYRRNNVHYFYIHYDDEDDR